MNKQQRNTELLNIAKNYLEGVKNTAYPLERTLRVLGALIDMANTFDDTETITYLDGVVYGINFNRGVENMRRQLSTLDSLLKGESCLRRDYEAKGGKIVPSTFPIIEGKVSEEKQKPNKISVEDTAKRLGVKPRTVNGYVRDGFLTKTEQGYIPVDSIERFEKTWEKRSGKKRTLWVAK